MNIKDLSTDQIVEVIVEVSKLSDLSTMQLYKLGRLFAEYKKRAGREAYLILAELTGWFGLTTPKAQ